MRLIADEEELIEALDSGEVPDVLIQDLHRRVCTRQIVTGIPRSTDGQYRMVQGWSLYETVLRPYFPQLPVIIVSVRGSISDNVRKANDYNLTIVEKKSTSGEDLVRLVAVVIATQRTVLRSIEAPPVVLVDFGKINEKLVHHLNAHPRDLHRLNWKVFEELIERLLVEMDYQVERTRLSRDGGVDLWAIKSTELSTVQYAIDTKHYGRHNHVGIQHVRAIFGVASLTNASVGMIITSSAVTSGARDLARQFRHRVSVKEYEDIVSWIDQVARRIAIT